MFIRLRNDKKLTSSLEMADLNCRPKILDKAEDMCHFELAAKECGFDVSFEIADPLLSAEKDLQYIATYSYKQ